MNLNKKEKEGLSDPEVFGLFPPVLFAPAYYYLLVSGCRMSTIDMDIPADRRKKKSHRFTVLGQKGEETLSCAISKFSSPTPWSQIKLSTHGQWWDKHLLTLATNYGAGPYYEYLKPEIESVLSGEEVENGLSLGTLVLRADAVIRSLLGLAPMAAPSLARKATEALDTGRTTMEISGRLYLIKDYRNNPFPGLSVLHDILTCGPNIRNFSKINRKPSVPEIFITGTMPVDANH